MEKDIKFNCNTIDLPGKKFILKRQAEKALDVLDFDKNSIYDTLRNRFIRAKKEISRYYLEVIEHYVSVNFEKISRILIEAFMLCTYDRFKLLCKALISKFREELL